MARALRVEYPGAVYHVMARGDGGKRIFEADEDHLGFLARLGEACASHGWRVHAWVLMGNHFHLLMETPQANLVSGMKWLLGVYSQTWNRSRQRRGHVFQGRYKAVPVNGDAADESYFRIVADYIHLNPARAGLAGGDERPLAGYRWSSLAHYAKGKGPDWLETDRVLGAFELSRDGRGRRAYVAWLEERAKQGGELSEAAMNALRRGWYLGEKSFRDRLLELLEKPALRRDPSRSGGAVRDRSLNEAERLVRVGLPALGLPDEPKALAALRKGDPRKVCLAMLLRKHTTAGNAWIAQRMLMGEPGSVSRLVVAAKTDPEAVKILKQLEEMLK
jgi:REP element-mobilizing transposase RayT